MICTVEIMGGLGNQLFQIFTLISYSLNEGVGFYFENKEITYGWRKKNYLKTPMLSFLKNYVRPILKTIIFKESNAINYNQIPSFKKYNKNVKLDGYFQSYKYFENKKLNIISALKIHELQKQVKTRFNSVSSIAINNTVSMHFRIGDYINIENGQTIMPLAYYEKALEQLLKDIPEKQDWNILYFFEKQDVERINKNIDKLKKNPKFSNLTFIPINHELMPEDWEQMLLMSLCSHHIIANSSFSWWGAYLNLNKQRPNIYYPSQSFIFKNDNEYKDMYPQNWIMIKK